MKIGETETYTLSGVLFILGALMVPKMADAFTIYGIFMFFIGQWVRK
jgi:hypothetical protein